MLRFLTIGRNLSVLSGPSHEVERVEAAKALCALGGRRVRRGLRRLLGHPDPEARRWAAYALGFTGEDRDAPLLGAKLVDPAEEIDVRAYAAEALGHIGGGPAEARDALVASLSDPAPEVRFWAAFALGQYGDATAIPSLRKVVETDEAVVPGWWSVSKEAADAIEYIRRFPDQS